MNTDEIDLARSKPKIVTAYPVGIFLSAKEAKASKTG
jgi:hypothetical protein